MDSEVVSVARPAAIATDDVRPGVVLLDQVRLRRPERVWGDRRADRPSHGSSSISQPFGIAGDGDRNASTQRLIRHFGE
jgi:hypothetical protein